MTRYPKVKDGEWVQPNPEYRIKCCDCGLVHRLEFRLHRNRIQMRGWRDEKETARARRKRPVRTTATPRRLLS